MTENANPMLLDVIGNLNPTKAFYIQHEKGTAEILDLTAQLATLFTREIGITTTSLVTAQSIATKKPPLPSAYQLFEENFIGTCYSLKNSSGEVLANSKKNLLSFGKATFTFSPFAGQAELAPVEVKRTGFWRWSEEFMVDGVKFRGQTVVGENESQQYDKVFLKVFLKGCSWLKT
jgi:hypothetical protein